ncbi:MAG: hypothetical protein NTV88_05930, partial [Candidatus Micrarchaeota archaeon]|nr:hypothetical protein [Candidatus Micrarchaeota archaeon]
MATKKELEAKKSLAMQIPHIPPQISAAVSVLNSIYQKIPIAPYLDRPTSALLYISFILYAAFVASIFLSSPVQMTPQILEDLLAKNTHVQLLPGEKYVYSGEGQSSADILTYQIYKNSSCSGAFVYEKETKISLCLSQAGNIEDPSVPAMNSSYGNKSIIMFAPWMLAVSDTFSWGFANQMSAGGAKVSLPVTLESQGRKTISGREAFEILVVPYAGKPSTIYIDSQKRVLLEAVSENVSVKLISA